MRTAISRFSLALMLVTGASLVWAQEPTPAPTDKSSTAAPDNTGKNERDRNPSEVTADQQKENAPDRDLARQVRQAIIKDKSLSTYAHNIKVIAQNGMVTLKGPVKTEQEKQSIEAKAAEAAGGADKVKSEIEVTGKN
jgi:osmotically-inducible protein OsmY